MPSVKQYPKTLKPYVSHGVSLAYQEGAKQANADCPFCGREGKFSVNVDTGLWRCLVCGTGNDKGGGNDRVFLKCLWEHGTRPLEPVKDLIRSRKFLNLATVEEWGAVVSPMTGEWLLPAFTPEGKIGQLYRCAKDPESGKFIVMATAEVPHQLLGMQHYDPNKPDLYLCEGHWDPMVLREILKITKRTDKGYALTSNQASSLYATSNVLAVPGCGTFAEQWCKVFSEKNVYMLYDNDHPTYQCMKCKKWCSKTMAVCPKCNGPLDRSKEMAPPSLAGMKRVAKLLGQFDDQPLSLNYLNWGPEGYDPQLPTGYDVRDMLCEKGMSTARIAALGVLLSKITPIPADWIPGRSTAAIKKGKPELDCMDCTSWKQLIDAWKVAMLWPKPGVGLDHGLASMLASIASTKMVGDQLWFKIVGPASCGKSTLCEAISTSKKYVVAKSTIRGFHSGFSIGNDEKEDNSLLSQLYDKTLVTKDGDTLLQSPNLSQILSEARDIYDKVSRTHYRNKMSKNYEGVQMTWLLCGTSSLRSLDSSELGERFLDCVIMEGIDDEQEDLILDRVVRRASMDCTLESGKDVSTQNNPDLITAMQLTGGYVNYLRENAADLMGQVRDTEEAFDQCKTLGKFVAYMRARPSLKQDETAEREFAARLVSQIMRLAKCLAVVLNKSSIDSEVMQRVCKVALDTARGRPLEIVKHLYNIDHEEGASVTSLAIWCHQTEDKKRVMLKFLRRIGVVDLFTPPQTAPGVKPRPRWRLSVRLRNLYEKILIMKEELL